MDFAVLPLDWLVITKVDSDKRFSKSAIRKLAKSIKEYGLLHPIIVVKRGEKYIVVDGNRRVLAYKLLKEEYRPIYDHIPALVIELENEEVDLAPLINQLQEKYNTLTLAKIIKELREKGYSLRRIANVLGVSLKSVHRITKILALPKSLQQEFLEGQRPLREIDKIDAQSLKKGVIRERKKGVSRDTLSDMEIFTERGKLRLCAVCMRSIVRDQVQHLYLCSDCLADFSALIRACRRYNISIREVLDLIARKYSKQYREWRRRMYGR